MDPRAKAIADSLPVQTTDTFDDDADEPERIPLQDIVITAVEHHEFNHFRVRKYDPDADGLTPRHGWAIVEGLPSAYALGAPHPSAVILYEHTVREGVEKYLDHRLSRGMDEAEARKMVDGVYTDVLVCDSIIQFALYGEEVFA